MRVLKAWCDILSQEYPHVSDHLSRLTVTVAPPRIASSELAVCISSSTALIAWFRLPLFSNNARLIIVHRITSHNRPGGAYC